MNHILPKVEGLAVPSATSDALLDVQNLYVCFHIPEGIVHAVNGVSFQVQPSEALAVVGESGSGKSVTTMSILGLIPIPPGQIAQGSAHYLGRDLLQMSEKELTDTRGKEIGMIFQDPMTSLNPVLTLRLQMTEALKKHFAISPDQADARAIELMDLVGISDAANRLSNYPHQFSGGMRQRVMIAMMLACNPSLLIADEPTTALDVTIQAQIVELVLRMREQLSMALIWITHDLGVVAGMADRVIVMYAGTIVEEAVVDDLYENPRHPYTLALLNALPRVDRRRDKRLESIPGAPPNMLVKPIGCPFAPRCTCAIQRCWSDSPTLTSLAPDHKAACWIDVRTGKAR